MRGTAFWELYYSPSIMDDAKWQVTADALDFAESNHEVLKNAKLFTTEGRTPSQDVYGYSAWNDEQGFVSFVNPTAAEKTFTLTLDDLVGVPQNMRDLAQVRIYPYASAPDGTSVSYGDTMQVRWLRSAHRSISSASLMHRRRKLFLPASRMTIRSKYALTRE